MLSSKKTSRYLFYAYLLLLSWGILLKFETDLSFVTFFYGPRIVNWIPFAQPLVVNGKIVVAEMVFNTLFFVPLGLCLPLIKPDWKSLQVLSTGFLVSLLYEVLQYILAIGMADVTDLLLNTLGTCLGFLLYQLLIKLWKEKSRKWINILGLIFVALPLFLLLVLVILGI